MRTNNQLHYYSTMPMEVTIFIAVGQTLLCFHPVAHQRNSFEQRYLAQFSSKIWYVIVEQGTVCTFLNLTFTILLNSASYEPFAYNSSGALQYTCDKVIVKFPQKCHKEIESHLVSSWKLNVENGIILCKHICHDASIVRQLIDESFSEFDFVSSKNKCYYGCNVCLLALTIVTFMGMIV